MKSTNHLPPRGHPTVLREVAEIFRLAPNTDYAALIPQRTAQQRINTAWNSTAQQMREALAEVQQRHQLPRFERRVD